MPVNVVLRHGRNYGWRRLWRAWIAVLGVLLVGLALVASLVAFPLIFGLSLIFVLEAQSPGNVPNDLRNIPWGPLWQLAGVSLVIAFFAVVVGMAFLRGKRKLILFLRRFGFDDATKAISLAAASSMGRRWRLVTLDDREVEPIGLTTPTRLLYRAASLVWGGLREAIGGPWALITKVLPISIVAVVAIPLIDYFTRPGPPKVATFIAAFGVYVRLLTDLVGTHHFPVLGLDLHLAFLIAVLLVVLAIGGWVVWFLLLLVALPLLGPYSMLSATAGGIARAERDKRVRIGGKTDIEIVARTIAIRSRDVFAPRLIVVKVSSTMWRPTVRRFADLSAAALIDLSEPTESLLWEIEQLMSIGGRVVFVGEYDRVLPLAVPSSSPSASIQDRLSSMIDGHQVLAYTRDRAGMSLFARELAEALETAAG
jgi:ABC-type multidrug transport system fused ATPase/permease subunit